MKERTDVAFGNYSTFPEEYFEVLRRVKQLPPFATFRLGPFPKGTAMNARRSYYRFREALREASTFEGDKLDGYARSCSAIANNSICTVVTDEHGSWVVFHLSPLVSAMRALEIDSDLKRTA